jgi:malonyl CoA-acyl carrier protein transacylase
MGETGPSTTPNDAGFASVPFVALLARQSTRARHTLPALFSGHSLRPALAAVAFVANIAFLTLHALDALASAAGKEVPLCRRRLRAGMSLDADVG